MHKFPPRSVPLRCVLIQDLHSNLSVSSVKQLEPSLNATTTTYFCIRPLIFGKLDFIICIHKKGLILFFPSALWLRCAIRAYSHCFRRYVWTIRLSKVFSRPFYGALHSRLRRSGRALPPPWGHGRLVASLVDGRKCNQTGYVMWTCTFLNPKQNVCRYK